VVFLVCHVWASSGGVWAAIRVSFPLSSCRLASRGLHDGMRVVFGGGATIDSCLAGQCVYEQGNVCLHGRIVDSVLCVASGSWVAGPDNARLALLVELALCEGRRVCVGVGCIWLEMDGWSGLCLSSVLRMYELVSHKMGRVSVLPVRADRLALHCSYLWWAAVSDSYAGGTQGPRPNL
jgi:hypothetical protein